MEKIEVFIIAMAPSTEVVGKFVIVLESDDRDIRFPILIGEAEAMSIGVALENIKIKRPLTHDLMIEMLRINGEVLTSVWIKERKDNIFLASLFIENSQGVIYELDARPSDALALAVRINCPIFIHADLIAERGLTEAIFASGNQRNSFSSYTLQELEELLKRVVDKEDYHSAIRIKESIERKKKIGN
jgi:bifunctional DNase/RNase